MEKTDPDLALLTNFLGVSLMFIECVPVIWLNTFNNSLNSMSVYTNMSGYQYVPPGAAHTIRSVCAIIPKASPG